MVSVATDTILIVEDDSGVATLERRRLERAGYSTVVASNSTEALDKLRQEQVDLILLDYRLPNDVDGLQFYEQVRKAGYDPPVILVTGFSSEATVIKALRAGVRDFVTKSVDYLDYLPQAVAQVLRQVRTETQLAESEARLAAIINSAKDAIIITEADQRITLFNPAAEQMFRCSAAAAQGRPLHEFMLRDLVPPEPGKGAESEEPASSVTVQVRMGNRGRRASGEVFPLEASISRTELGGRRFYTVVVRDITERKRVERRLQQQAALLDQAKDAILVQTLDERIVYWNRGAERLYGWSAKEAVGRPAAERLPALGPVETSEALQTVLATGAWSGELRQRCRQGQEITVESRWTLVRDEDNRPKSCLIINTDVTEKKKLETQLAQAQRMEGIGVLAGGVAHDFNNLLTVINGYADIIVAKLPAEDPALSFVQEIRRAGDRAATLTRQLLAFSRRQVLAPVVLDVNRLVSEIEKLLRRLIGEDVELTFVLDPRLGQVKADPGQLEQVLLNLLVNARDAMPTGGQLTLETHNVELDAVYASRHPEVRPGRYAMLAVTDTGCGMDQATKAHIFEPFFTTKAPGKGTGLGLATVYGIVKQSGGHIEVYSELNHGTTFKVYLPRVEEPRPSVPGTADQLRVPTGTETVLVAEDEDSVRSIVRLVLQSGGYFVLEASNGEEALALARQYPEQIDLLITDVVMPKMSGRQLAAAIVLQRPQLRILYLSGYTDDAVVRHGVLEAGVAFLQKPFSPTQLARKVREMLDA